MASYDDQVFVNCPFDREYAPLLRALVFCIFDCGFVARTAQESEDSSTIRVDKIFKLIRDSRFSIHDLSRVELDTKTQLPRFNMPFELGAFVAAKRFGTGRQKRKVCLILDVERYRFQKFLSDIAGQDIRAHAGSPRRLVIATRNWLRTNSTRRDLPGGEAIWKRFQAFDKDLSTLCKAARLNPKNLHFVDYSELVYKWIRRYP